MYLPYLKQGRDNLIVGNADNHFGQVGGGEFSGKHDKIGKT